MVGIKNQFKFIFTSKCNYDCKYCFVDTNTKDMEVMSKETFNTVHNAILHYINDKMNSNIQLVYFGGEPLLEYEMVLESLDFFASFMTRHKDVPLSIRANVFTNGAVNHEKFLEGLDRFNKKYPSLANTSLFRVHIQYSFDGPVHLIGDTFKKTDIEPMLLGAKALPMRGSNMTSGVMTVFSNDTIDKMFEIYKYMVDNNLHKNWVPRMDIGLTDYSHMKDIAINQFAQMYDYMVDNNINITNRSRYSYKKSYNCMSGLHVVGINPEGYMTACYHNATLSSKTLKELDIEHVKIETASDIDNFHDLTITNFFYDKKDKACYDTSCPYVPGCDNGSDIEMYNSIFDLTSKAHTRFKAKEKSKLPISHRVSR